MADWSDIEHAAGDTDYIEHLNTLVARAESVATELETARDGESTLDARLNGLVANATGLTANLPGNAQRITGLADPVDGQDAATMAWANALLVAGGSPASIPVTGLNPGTASASQLLRIDSGGTAPEGVALSSLPVTGLDKGTASASQLLRVNSGGTALEGVSPASLPVAGFGVGGLGALQALRVNSGATALEGYTPAVFATLSKSSAYTLVTADAGKLVRLTGTWTLAFQAAATLGADWVVDLYNEGSGALTLDPNSSELIDGLSSFVLYPGELRRVWSTGTALVSVVLKPFCVEFLSSGTFVKPPGYAAFSGFLWGGGGSGGRCNGGYTAGGGGGGAGVPVTFMASTLGATETVTIGAGGAARTSAHGFTDGLAGGNSSFKGVVAYGGGGGGGGSVSSITAGGGGALSAGTKTEGGAPSGAVLATDGRIYGGGLGGGVAGEGRTLYGGGWSTLFGGASGGRGSTTAENNVGGTSALGGAGGAGLSHGTNSATAGTQPGGGGGGLTYTYGNPSGNSGAGAAGGLSLWGVV